MNLKKIILSIMCFIGLSGMFGSICYSLIILLGIQLNGMICFIEPNPLILTIEIITIVIGLIIFPIVSISTIKYIDKLKN